MRSSQGQTQTEALSVRHVGRAIPALGLAAPREKYSVVRVKSNMTRLGGLFTVCHTQDGHQSRGLGMTVGKVLTVQQ